MTRTVQRRAAPVVDAAALAAMATMALTVVPSMEMEEVETVDCAAATAIERLKLMLKLAVVRLEAD